MSIDLAQEKIAECKAILAPQVVGNDIADLIDKLKDWVVSLGLGDYTRQGLDMLYHLFTEQLLPWVLELTPTYIDIAINGIVVPFLKTLHDKYLHPATA